MLIRIAWFAECPGEAHMHLILFVGTAISIMAGFIYHRECRRR